MSNNVIELKTSDQLDTIKLAESIAKNLSGGEVIELTSDLGGGKTTFTKGLALGINSKDRVSSPSFTIENIYEGDKLSLHHLDFYRLNDPGILKDMMSETMRNEKTVVVVEWADIVEDVLPHNRLIVNILATGESERTFKLTYPKDLSYLVKDIK